MSPTDQLLNTKDLHSKLYDVGSMIEMKRSVASGFVILLNGGPASPSTSDGNEGLPLAFMSLTSGNVIEACFGVENPVIRDDTPARRSAREAKTLLGEHDTTDSFRQVAVSAYCEGFKAIIDYNEQMEKLNCLSKCFRSKKIREETEQKVWRAFSPLVTALQDSS